MARNNHPRNYYLDVVKRRVQMKRDPSILAFAKRKKLNKQQVHRMVVALLAGKSSFDEKL